MIQQILIAIIWVCYGLFAAYQTDDRVDNFCDLYVNWIWVLYIIFAPIVFIVKAFYGVFKTYD